MPSSLTLTLPSLTTDVDEVLFSVWDRERSEVWEELLYAGDCRLSPAMFPGRLELVFGVRLRRGRSVGGRGAGPGFMNWSLEYMLDRQIISGMSKSWKAAVGREIEGQKKALA